MTETFTPITIARYCLCGASLQARSTPPATAEAFAAEFDARHTGDRHGPTTAAKAAQARLREERQLLAEETS